MFVSFEEAFNPSKEKLAATRKLLIEMQEKDISEKRCRRCKNTYGEYWNNHGHDDQTNHCIFTKKCIDFSSGKRCPHWEPKEINTFEELV